LGRSPRRLFEGFGVELEYMIVDRATLAVKPVADEVLRAVAGAYESEVEVGALRWSNELVLHVIELKTNGPAASLERLPDLFAAHVARINELLAPHRARLMPTGMHPWMDPLRETRLWPHEYSPVYETFNRIFSCRGHGWANLQSIHLNLPFGDDAEFARLHAAVRLVLPILPALAASTPLVEGRLTGRLDNRLEAYRTNARRIPSVTGRVIPEPVFSRAAYETQILRRMYDDIAPHDPEGILQYEWLNARGAIARFDRQTIEIRVLDAQESPRAETAILAAVVAVLRALADERWADLTAQTAWPVAPLETIFRAAIQEAERARVSDPAYLAMFGLHGVRECTAGALWAHLLAEVLPPVEGAAPFWAEPLRTILAEGTLARRVVEALGGDLSRARLAAVYGELCDCLSENRVFHARR